MPRFSLDDREHEMYLDLQFDHDERTTNKDKGDAKLSDTIGSFLKNEVCNGVTKQKRDFSHRLNCKGFFKPVQDGGESSGLEVSQTWECGPDVTGSPEGDHTDGTLSAGSEGDHFYKVYHAKSPSAEKAAAVLDELVKLREELVERIQDLARFKQEVREVGTLIQADPWEKVQTSSPRLQKKSERADKMLDSMELTTHRIESLCGELDQTAISDLGH